MKNILVVSAHAADWCTRSGGTLIKYSQMGYKINVIALTYGIHGESRKFWVDHPDGTMEDCAKLRAKELDAVASYLDANIQCMGYEDYPLTMDEARIRKLTNQILDLRPELIFTHWTEDTLNPDHATAAQACIKAVAAAGRLGARPNTLPISMPDVFFYESTLPNSQFNHFEINTFIDITDVYEKKIEAVKCFSAQPELVPFYDNCSAQRAREANDWIRKGGIKYERAEAFHRFLPYCGSTLPLSEHNR